MKNKKKSLILSLSILIALFFNSLAFAAYTQWRSGKVKHLATYNSNNDSLAYVTLHNVSISNCPTKDGNSMAALPNNEDGQRMYAALLTAKVTGKNVIVGYYPYIKTPQGKCMIESVHYY